MAMFWALLLANPLARYYQRGFTDPGWDGLMVFCSVLLGMHLIAIVLCVRRRQRFRFKNPVDAFLEILILGSIEVLLLWVVTVVA